VARRIVDRHMLGLIKAWLVAPVEEDDGKEHDAESGESGQQARHAPGSTDLALIVEPVHATVRRGLETTGAGAQMGGPYRQLCRRLCDLLQTRGARGDGRDEAGDGEVETDVNEDKTHLCELPRERFDFLGYTFGKCYSAKDGHAYIGTVRQRRALSGWCEHQRGHGPKHAAAGRRGDGGSAESKADGLGELFLPGPVRSDVSAARHPRLPTAAPVVVQEAKVAGNGKKRYPDQYLREELGLVHLSPRTHNLPWRKA